MKMISEKTTVELTRGDLYPEYRDLPLCEIQIEHIMIDMDMETTYILRDGVEEWNARYINPAHEIIARETIPATLEFAPFFTIRGFSPEKELSDGGLLRFVKDKFKSIRKSRA